MFKKPVLATASDSVVPRERRWIRALNRPLSTDPPAYGDPSRFAVRGVCALMALNRGCVAYVSSVGVGNAGRAGA